jgi:hypothetical protein
VSVIQQGVINGGEYVRDHFEYVSLTSLRNSWDISHFLHKLFLDARIDEPMI